MALLNTSSHTTDVRRELGELLGLAGTATTASIGRGRPLWAHLPAHRLFKPPLAVLNAVPVARDGALDFLGLLVHESAHLHLMEQDSVGGKIRADCGGVDEAVETLVEHLRGKLERQPGVWRRLLLKWSTELLGELSTKNAGRRSTSGKSPQALMTLFLAIPAVQATAELMRTCLQGLLAKDPEECLGVVIGSANFGAHFEWVLAYIGSCFPKTIVEHLIRLGLADWEVAATAEAGPGGRAVAEVYEGKLRSLGAILWYVAILRRNELAAEICRILQTGLGEGATAKQRREVLFIFKLATSRLDMLAIILRTAHPFLTEENVVKVMRHWSTIPWRNVHTEKDTIVALDRMATSLDQEMLSLLLSPLLRLAFPTSPAKSEYRADLSRFATRILEDAASNLIQLVQYQGAFAISGESELLDTLDSKMDELLSELFSPIPAKRSLLFRLLTTTALARGETRALEFLAQLLFTASQPSMVQLGVVAGAGAYLVPFFPDLVANLVSRLPALRPSVAKEETNGRWLENLMLLARMERQAAEDDPVLDLRLCYQLSVHFGSWVPEVIAYTLEAGSEDEEERLGLGWEGGKEGERLRRAEWAVGVAELVGVPAPQMPRHLTRALDAFAELLFRLLARAHQKEERVLEILRTLSSYLVHFLSQQEDFARRHFLRRLLRTAAKAHLPHDSAALYAGVLEDSEGVFGGRGSEKTAEKKEESLLTQLGEMSRAKKRSLPSLVHSGTIRNKKAPPPAQLTATGIFRRFLFLETVEGFCRQRGSDDLMVGTACEVGEWVVEVVCEDAVAGHGDWSTWDEEKMGLDRLLSTSRRLRALVWPWELLTALAPAYPALWYALPLVKARLGATLAELESAVDKSRGLSPTHLDTLQDWVALAVEGELIPVSLGQTAELLPYISTFEAIALLLEIWRYLQDVRPDEGRLGLVRSGKEGRVGLDPAPYRVLARSILQANITTTAHLYPILFPQ